MDSKINPAKIVRKQPCPHHGILNHFSKSFSKRFQTFLNENWAYLKSTSAAWTLRNWKGTGRFTHSHSPWKFLLWRQSALKTFYVFTAIISFCVCVCVSVSSVYWTFSKIREDRPYVLNSTWQMTQFISDIFQLF